MQALHSPAAVGYGTMATSPMISVVIPTKNRPDLTIDAVGSLIAQSDQDWEAIVVDDGSNQATITQLKEFIATDARIHFVPRQPTTKAGASACRNIGISMARGNYVVFLDSDDVLEPRCLETRRAAMAQRADLDVGFFQVQIFHHLPGDLPYVLNIAKPQNPIDRILYHDFAWMTGSGIWKKEFLKEIGGFNDGYIQRQDTDLHFRALVAGARYQEFGRRDYYWRVGGADRISTFAGAAQLENWESILIAWIKALNQTNQMTAERAGYLAANLFAIHRAYSRTRGRALAMRQWFKATSGLDLNYPLKALIGGYLLMCPSETIGYPLLMRLLPKAMRHEEPKTMNAVTYEDWLLNAPAFAS